jgi:hypothetical protein
VIKTNNPGGTSYAAYSANFTASAAIHTLSFIGTDLAGGDNTVFIDNVRISPSLHPLPASVALIIPTNNAVFSLATPVMLTATVTTNANFISGVQFFADATNLIGQVTTQPYIYSWSSAGVGAHSIFAQVIFDGTNTADSSVANITVINPSPVIGGIGTAVDGTLSIWGAGLSNYLYFLDTASNLTPPIVWTPILTNLSDASGNISFTNLAPTNVQQFFRLSAP